MPTLSQVGMDMFREDSRGGLAGHSAPYQASVTHALFTQAIASTQPPTTGTGARFN